MKKFIFILLFLPIIIFAEVTSSISQQNGYVGDTIYLTHKVEAKEKGIKFSQLPQIDGLDIKYEGENLSTSSYTQIINGKITSNKTFSYNLRFRITSLKSGSYTIPEMTIYYDGKSSKTVPIKITFDSLKQLSDYQLKVNVPYNTIYVNQLIKGTVSLTVNSDIEELDIRIPFFEDNSVSAFTNNQSNIIGNLKIGQTIFPVSRNVIERNGKEHLVFEFDFLLTATEEKIIDLSTASASFNAIVGVKNYVDNFGFPYQEKEKKRISIPADKKVLTVKSVLKPYPENWTGIIGKPKLSMSCEATEASVGDPITFTLEVDGIADKSIDIYPINKMKEWSDNFKIPETHSPAFFENGVKKYLFTVRALNENVKELPAYNLVYFDVEEHKFKTIQSNSIPLTIKKSQVVGVDKIEDFSNNVILNNKVQLLENYGVSENILGDKALKDDLKIDKIVNILILIILVVFILAFIVVLSFYFINKSALIKKSNKKIFIQKLNKIKNIENNMSSENIDSSLLNINTILKDDFFKNNFSEFKNRVSNVTDYLLYSNLNIDLEKIKKSLEEILESEYEE